VPLPSPSPSAPPETRSKSSKEISLWCAFIAVLFWLGDRPLTVIQTVYAHRFAAVIEITEGMRSSVDQPVIPGGCSGDCRNRAGRWRKLTASGLRRQAAVHQARGSNRTGRAISRSAIVPSLFLCVRISSTTRLVAYTITEMKAQVRRGADQGQGGGERRVTFLLAT
jgi:hypothetical protein